MALWDEWSNDAREQNLSLWPSSSVRANCKGQDAKMASGDQEGGAHAQDAGCKRLLLQRRTKALF